MRKQFMIAAAGAVIFSLSPALAEERATQADAKAMVQKAVAAYKINRANTLTAMTAPSKTYVSKDLYLSAHDLNGTCLAHGQNKDRVGTIALADKDVDGREFIKERLEKGKASSSFWQDYKFLDPLSNKVLAKTVYCEKADAKTLICGGVYQQNDSKKVH